MTMNRYEEFQAFRTRLNRRILGGDREGDAPSSPSAAATHDHAATAGASPNAPGPQPTGATLTTKRFFNLDAAAYKPGALDVKTKELLGLVASMVLRCDDCIAYHIDQCISVGVSDEELWECFDIALIVGGSIVIPHMRRGVDFLDQARAARAKAKA